MCKRVILVFVLLVSTAGCGVFEKSKDFVKENAPSGNPLREASSKESLIQARSEVKTAKKVYNSCMEKNDQDVYKCMPERERYDAATERYIELQQNSN